MSEYSMILTTCGDKESAKALAAFLVEAKLAACVQMFPVESIYVWQGSVCNESETVLFIKTKTEMYDKAAAAIRENHSYEVPEIIQIPITAGLPEYLRWIDETVQ